MFIITQLKELALFVIKNIIILIALVGVSLIAPFVLAILPQVILFQNPQADVANMGLFFFWVTPWCVAVWMIFLCQFHSARLWQQEGKEFGAWGTNWRKAHGGIFRTAGKSTGFMLLGFFGAFASEVAFLLLTHGHRFNLVQKHLWFAAFPFVAFAPVILLLFKRRNYSESRPADLKATEEKTSNLTNGEYQQFLKKELADRTADGEISMGDWLELRKANGF